MSGEPLVLRKPRASFYRDMVLARINEYYKLEEPYFPKQVEIIDSIYLTVHKKDPYTLPKEELVSMRKSMQSSVSKAIDALIKSGDIVEVESGKYGPNNEAVSRIKYGNYIVYHIAFNRPDVFVMSSSMIAIDVSDGFKDAAADAFKSYLGKERCFDVIYFDKYLVILIIGNKEHKKETKKLIDKIVKEAYDIQ